MDSTNDGTTREVETLDDLFTCFTDGGRRRLLGELREKAPAPMTIEALGTALAAWNDEKPRAEVTDEERQKAMATLHHVQLPMLEDAGLIERDADGGFTTVSDHPAFRDSGILTVIDDEASADADSLDALFGALADDRRRTILDVLSHQYQAIQLETLAKDVLAAERNESARDVTEEEVEGLLVSLHHDHLPVLADAGIVGYDADERTVAYEGHPDLRVSWMHSSVGDDFRATLSESPEEAAVWDLEGRERIVSCGQSLCDQADEELFLLFTTTGLLEVGCFTRIAQAAERGVDVYVGTCDQTVRDFVRKNAPEATLWEPETDWLNLPVAEDNVGRLVFADREAVMIGTLGEKDDDGVHEEQAIFGDGSDNTLVVLLRQMLRSRMDQFDERDREIDIQL